MLECVPNVSEGRGRAWMREAVEGLSRVPGVSLADVSRDTDHDRTVLTLFGSGAALAEALLPLFSTALDHIDLERHAGVHPRVGAVDVTPFVPLHVEHEPWAVGAARRFGERVACALELPVFLYGLAATDERLGVPAGLRRLPPAEIALQMASGDLRPDFGPARWDPRRGVCLIGARRPLIAFNFLLGDGILGDPDLRSARRIARAVRESNGGLPAIQALGLLLPSRKRAQVSTNVLDFRRTSLYELARAVAAEAAALGQRVVETELVGLVPRAALEGGDPAEIGLAGLPPEKFVETYAEL